MAYSSFFGSFRKTRFVIGALLAAQLSNTSPKLAAAELPAASQPAQKSFDDHLVQANVLFKAGKLGESLAEVQAAAKEVPNRYEAPATASLILHAAGKAAEARGALDAAMKLAPPDKQEKLQDIAKLLASPPAAGTSPTNSPTAPNALTGPARRQLGMLMLIIEEADKAKLDTERKKLLGEFLEKSEPFLKDNPNHLPVWTLRAVAALELNQPKPGWEAGQQLTKFGADNSEDPKVQKVMAMLDRKGWFSKKAPADPSSATKENPFVNSLGMKFVPVAGAKVLFCIWETRLQDFEAFVKATGHDAMAGMMSLRAGKFGEHGDSWKHPGFTQDSTHPVCGVNWVDAQAFCRWLSQKEGQAYRLSTDAEWSLAVGLTGEAGDSPKDKDRKIENVYPWGSQWPPPNGAGNYAGEEARDADWPPGGTTIDGYRDSYARTAPVGSFNANRSGLYDLGGDVWEWCEDWYDGEQKSRVLRGGSWGVSNPDLLLSSHRRGGIPVIRLSYFGFRCVLVHGETR